MGGDSVSRRRPIVLAVLVGAIVVVVDQLSKAIVRGTMLEGEAHSVLPGVDLVRVHNPGIAFGLFGGRGGAVVIITVVALAALLFFFSRNVQRPLLWLPTGLILGGAVGNLIDRVVAGSVTDFINLPLWPTFNVADVCITVGIISLLLIWELSSRKRSHAAQA